VADTGNDDRRGRRDLDPVVGSAIAILALLYLVYLAWLLATRGAGLPDWLIVLSALPLVFALVVYGLAVVIQILMVARRRGTPARDPGDGTRDIPPA
jgi:hypothetical protein